MSRHEVARCESRPCTFDATPPRPTRGIRNLCDPCVRRLAANILRTGQLYTALEDHLAPVSPRGSERVSGSAETPLTVRPVVVELRDQIRHDIAYWCKVVSNRKAAGCPTNITGAASWLANHAATLAADPDAAAATEVFGGLVAEARRAIDLPRDRTRIPVGPCPEHLDQEDFDKDESKACGGTVVAHIPQSPEEECTYLRCQACGTTWDRGWARVGRQILQAART